MIELDDLSGKSLAIDAYNALYQFLAIIRTFDGSPLKDRSGRVTSHLSGLLYRTANLMEKGIKVIYVFDGEPPSLKEAEIKRRMKVKEEAVKKYEAAIIKGDLEEARVYAQMTSRLKDYMTDDSKKLLDLMGVPWIQAPSEGEAQAAHIVRKGDAGYCASQDFDSLLFGAPRLVRNVTISGRRKLPRKRAYVEVFPELVELERVLKELNISREQLIDVGILVGTDFNPEGVKGVGPKTALKMIKKYGCIEEIPSSEIPEINFDPKPIREIFLNPKVTDDYRIEWRKPDIDGVIDFLCGERDFSRERVEKAVNRMYEGYRKLAGRRTLDSFFK